MSLKTIRIDVISDFVCAWCYIGHIELEQGIALAKARGLPVSFTVRYHPFFLNHCLKDDVPFSKATYFEKKFPSSAQAAQIVGMAAKRGRTEGLALSFKGDVRQTTRAHRLCMKAYNVGGERAQCATLRRLFRAFLEQEKDIGDARTLAILASSATHPFAFPAEVTVPGVDRAELEAIPMSENVYGTPDADDDDAAQIFDSEEEALEWIEGNELEAEVRNLSRDAAAKGIKGVPFTVIDGRWAVSGCQKPECYYKIFEKIVTAEMSMPKSDGLQPLCTSGSMMSSPCPLNNTVNPRLAAVPAAVGM